MGAASLSEGGETHHHPLPDWVHQQACLNPHPKELMLRNHL
jgi:hypothetical protein